MTVIAVDGTAEPERQLASGRITRTRRCLMQKRKINSDMIRLLVDEGLSAQEIADRVGWTVGTLRVRCSQLKISLRRSGKSKSHMCLAVPNAIFGQLQHQATLMGISESELATDLLKTIVQDDLCDAVLDREVAEAPLVPSLPLPRPHPLRGAT